MVHAYGFTPRQSTRRLDAFQGADAGFKKGHKENLPGCLMSNTLSHTVQSETLHKKE